MIFAYADPPYVGCHNFYPEKEPEHYPSLLQLLSEGYPEGWVLSCHTPSLGYLLSLAPSDVRIGAWVKPFCSFKPGVNPAYAWEPVLFRGGRKRARSDPTVRDWVSANITLKRGLVGCKPEEFCRWVIQLMGALPEDEFHDLYPGTGAFGRAWEDYGALAFRHGRPL